MVACLLVYVPRLPMLGLFLLFILELLVLFQTLLLRFFSHLMPFVPRITGFGCIKPLEESQGVVLDYGETGAAGGHRNWR